MLQPTYADSTLIVPRGTLPSELHAELTSSDSVKLLIAGQRGMGKTTELRRLLELFNPRETISVFVQFGAQEKITNAMLVSTMAGRLMQVAGSLMQMVDHQSEAILKARDNLKSWFYSEEHTETYQEGDEGSAFIGGDIKILEAKKGVRHSKNRAVVKTRQTNRDMESLIDLFNSLIHSIRKHTGRKIVFIVDDIDKIQNMDSIQHAFIHSAHVVNRIDAPCVFTVPITYATSSIVRIGALPYGEIYRVPAVEVIQMNGQQNTVAFAFMREVLKRRMSSNPIPPSMLDDIIKCSGGVIVDALRVARIFAKSIFLKGAKSTMRFLRKSFKNLSTTTFLFLIRQYYGTSLTIYARRQASLQ